MPTPPGKTYADIIKTSLQNPRDRKSMREVGRNIGYSYEHVRKAVSGEVLFTREFNDAICQELKLDAEGMWRLAQEQKLREKYAGADLPADIPRDPRAKEIWKELDPEAREAWIEMGQALLAVAERARRRQPVRA